MEIYEQRILTHNDFFEYESFMFLEGQYGLPDMIDEIYGIISGKRLETWIIQDIFSKPERIKAIPYLNPSVIIFQTTMMSRDKIEKIIKYLESKKWSPKEIWQIVPNDRPIVDSDQYEVFSPYVLNGCVRLTKI